MREVFVRAEKRQIVPDGKLREKSINRPHLDTRLATLISDGCSSDVVVPIRLQQRQGGKALDDLSLGHGAREPLQQLLKGQAGGDYDI